MRAEKGSTVLPSTVFNRLLYRRLLNRLGEALWMDGNYTESLQYIESATAGSSWVVIRGEPEEGATDFGTHLR
jgi:hypothetical protein